MFWEEESKWFEFASLIIYIHLYHQFDLVYMKKNHEKIFSLVFFYKVMIWQKAPKLDKNQCIGEAFIQLDCLDLSQQTIGWYKLYKQHAVDSDFYDSA